RPHPARRSSPRGRPCRPAADHTRPRRGPSRLPREAPAALRGAMSEPAVRLRLDGPVLWIGLNRPERHNIYNLAMRDALHEAFGVAAEHPDVGAAVVHGEGPDYSAGADLREFGTAPSQDVARRVRFARDVWGRILDCPRPVIAALHGHCLGSGLELA